MTDAAGLLVWDRVSLPFGATHAENGLGDGTAIRFPGQLWDAETGYHYNYFRDYDPSTGRYLQPDPIGLQGGLNRYGYVGANPVNLTDPYGLEDQKSVPIYPAVPGDNYFSPFGEAARGRRESAAELWDYICENRDEILDWLIAGMTRLPPQRHYSEEADDSNAEKGDKKREREKKGRPRDPAKQRKQVRDAANEAGLTPEERRDLGREVEERSRQYGEDLGYQDILDIARDLKKGR